MTNSILLTIKKMLGSDENYAAFDSDLITDINSVFLTLNQIGVGSSGFQITGAEEVWSDFVKPSAYPGIQSYVFLKTKLLFDPPSNSFLIDNIKKQIEEFEFRLNVQAEYVSSAEAREPSAEEQLLSTFSAMKSSKRKRGGRMNVQSDNK